MGRSKPEAAVYRSLFNIIRKNIPKKDAKAKLEQTGLKAKFSPVHTPLKVVCLLLRVEIPPTGNQMSTELSFQSSLVRPQFIALACKKYLFPASYLMKSAFFQYTVLFGYAFIPGIYSEWIHLLCMDVKDYGDCRNIIIMTGSNALAYKDVPLGLLSAK